VSEKVRIRAATPEDADAIAEVFIASFATLSFLPRLHTNAETIDFVGNKVLREQEVLVAEQNGGIVRLRSDGTWELLGALVRASRFTRPRRRKRAAHAREAAYAEWVPPLALSAEHPSAPLL
jgi:hypothetical protein